MAQRVARLLARSAAALQPTAADHVLVAPVAMWLLATSVQRNCLQQLHGSAQQRRSEEEAPEAQQRKALINRMLYRSRQRGFLELDLLIGMWAEKQLPSMSTEMVQELEVVLEQENPDMFKWITGQVEAPPELQQNRAFQLLRQHVKSMTDQHHKVPPAAAAGEQPKEWVRGWSDSGKELAG